jgi:hypothetical protein
MQLKLFKVINIIKKRILHLVDQKNANPDIAKRKINPIEPDNTAIINAATLIGNTQYPNVQTL